MSPSPNAANLTASKYRGPSFLRNKDRQKALALLGSSPWPVVEVIIRINVKDDKED